MIEFISKRTLSYNITETKKKNIDFPTLLMEIVNIIFICSHEIVNFFLLRSHEIVCELKVH